MVKQRTDFTMRKRKRTKNTNNGRQKTTARTPL